MSRELKPNAAKRDLLTVSSLSYFGHITVCTYPILFYPLIFYAVTYSLMSFCGYCNADYAKNSNCYCPSSLDFAKLCISS